MSTISEAWEDFLVKLDEGEEGMSEEQLEKAELCFYCGALFILSEFESITNLSKYKKFEKEITQKLQMDKLEMRYEN
jgi:DNA-directed RNA polymerase subunit N (RpoN/RPB10)